jgi:hypothetical protein
MVKSKTLVESDFQVDSENKVQPKKTLEFRIQKVEADSSSGRLIAFIKEGFLDGVAIAPSSMALQILSMCLQPYAEREVLTKSELKSRTAMCVQLMLIHCQHMCNWAGLDFSSFLSNEIGLVAESKSNNLSQKFESSLDEMKQEESAEEDEISSFSLSNSDFDELDFD